MVTYGTNDQIEINSHDKIAEKLNSSFRERVSDKSIDDEIKKILSPHRKQSFLSNLLSGPVVAGLWLGYQVLWWVIFYYIVLRPRLNGMPLRVFLYRLYVNREEIMAQAWEGTQKK